MRNKGMAFRPGLKGFSESLTAANTRHLWQVEEWSSLAAVRRPLPSGVL